MKKISTDERPIEHRASRPDDVKKMRRRCEANTSGQTAAVQGPTKKVSRDSIQQVIANRRKGVDR